MANQNYTHMAFIIDRSGSMSGIARSMKEGFNEFIEGQKTVEGDATVTLARFDNEYEMIYDFVELGQVGSLELNPRGGTALLDGMGKTMNSVRQQIMEMPVDERPGKCVFIFITDGDENSSREYTRDQVFQMIEDCKADDDINFEFVFLGANQDAISAGNSFGIRSDASLTYDATDAGTKGAMRGLTQGITKYRCSSAPEASLSYTSDDRNDAMGISSIIPNLDSQLINDVKKKK